jgi:hypothetical protein
MVKLYTNNTFDLYFGKKSFIPIMCVMQKYLPAKIFSNMSYNMFCYLFNWGDHFWKKSRKVKYFLFSPRPLSCKLMLHWCSIIKEGILHPFRRGLEDHNKQYCNIKSIQCPVALFYSTGIHIFGNM